MADQTPVAAAPTYDDEGVGLIVLFFGLIGVAIGCLIGVVILVTATPPQVDLAHFVTNVAYRVACPAKSVYCMTHDLPFPGPGLGLLVIPAFVGWNAGALVASATDKVAWTLTRPGTPLAGLRGRGDIATVAVAIAAPAAVTVYFMVIARSLVLPAALVVLAVYAGDFAWIELRTLRSGIRHAGRTRIAPARARGRSSRVRTTQASRGSVTNWASRLAAIATLLFFGGLSASVIVYAIGRADLSSTLLTYVLVLGSPVVLLAWIAEEAVQAGGNRRTRILDAAVAALLIAFAAYVVAGLVNGSIELGPPPPH
jgi:hypothetical protein